VLVGLLGALLLGVLLYVVTLNQINSRTSEVARAQTETQKAEARAASLGPFGEFAAVKATREASVKSLAEARVDWERVMRELSLVLPSETWLTELDASAAGTSPGGSAPSGASGQGSGSSGQPAAPSSEAAGGPTLHLVGCAKNQRDVATMLVRLRRLNGVGDVDLAESAREEEGAGGAAAAAGDASSNPTSCAPDYKFDLSVSFAAAGPTAPTTKGTERVPATLGGGS
jgi:Tfp pilus assembly protein PilN